MSGCVAHWSQEQIVYQVAYIQEAALVIQDMEVISFDPEEDYDDVHDLLFEEGVAERFKELAALHYISPNAVAAFLAQGPFEDMCHIDCYHCRRRVMKLARKLMDW